MKKVLIDAAGSSSWIGGLYYIKNFLFSVISNKNIMQNNEIIIAYDECNFKLFQCFGEKCKLIKTIGTNPRLHKIEMLIIALLNHVDIIYPYWEKPYFSLFGIEEICWFADYQECHFPEFYTEKDLNNRKQLITSVVRKNKPIVFSSYDTKNDLENNYGKDKNEYVVPFVSYIENELNDLTGEFEQETLKKYGITKRYACVCNQFWQHKNHIVIFNAIMNLYAMNPNIDFEFVFTGKMEDYRNPNYIDGLKRIVSEPGLNKHIKVLGFVDRDEQLALMKNAEYIIQPSLFEGWGTVVEDAKVLDKTILLSDIPVHREQMNDKCILFDPYDSGALAELLEIECGKEHIDDVEKGIADMHERAEEYSKGFEQLLKDLRGNSF